MFHDFEWIFFNRKKKLFHSKCTKSRLNKPSISERQCPFRPSDKNTETEYVCNRFKYSAKIFIMLAIAKELNLIHRVRLVRRHSLSALDTRKWTILKYCVHVHVLDACYVLIINMFRPRFTYVEVPRHI